MKLTRRQLVAGAAGAALGAAGIYELADQLSGSPARTAAVPLGPRSVEQHVLDGIPVVEQDGVQVIVPPRHHLVVTATVKPGTDLAKAQPELEQALRELESRYEQTPAGLGLTVAWGLPYFDRYVAAAAEKHVPFDRRAQKPALLADPHVPERPARHAPGGERRRAAHPQRPARAHRGRAQDAARRPRRLRARQPPPRIRRRQSPAQARHRRRRSRRVPDPARLRALPRLHVDAEGRPRAAPDRELRDARPRRSPRRLLPRRHAHAPLPHLRGPRGLVPQLRVPGARRHGVPAGAEGEGERAGRPAGTEAGVERAGGGARFQERRTVRPQRVDPDELAAPAGHDGRGRHALREGDRHSAARRLQHARQPVRVVGRPEARRRRRRRRGRRPFRRLQPVQRRLPPQPARHGRRAAGRDEAPAAAAGARPGLQLGAAARRTARTSSSRRARTGRSRSPSFSRDRRRQLRPGGARAPARARGWSRRRGTRLRVRRGCCGDGRDGALRRHGRARSGAGGRRPPPARGHLEGRAAGRRLARRAARARTVRSRVRGRRSLRVGRDPRARRAGRPDREGRPDARARDRRRSRARVSPA